MKCVINYVVQHWSTVKMIWDIFVYWVCLGGAVVSILDHLKKKVENYFNHKSINFPSWDNNLGGYTYEQVD